MRRQRGFGVIAAIVVLVILATLAAAIVALSTTQSSILAQDILSARAVQSARAGTEWGLFQAFSNANVWNGGTASCNTGTEALPVTATVDTSAVNGMQATVTCWSRRYSEGEESMGVSAFVRLYQVSSVACPNAPCPQTGPEIARANYVERRREAIGMF
jgi:MSHA biogenesis protein MshP